MAWWTERRGVVRQRAVALAAFLAAFVAAAPAVAQDTAATGATSPGRDTVVIRGSLFERLNLDRLRLVALGAAVGRAKAAQTVGTEVFTLFADYGEVAPRWRVVFSVSYWGSRLEDDVVEAFADSVRGIVIDPSGDDVLFVPRIKVSDIALATDIRWSPFRSSVLRPYLGGGFTAHVVNAEGEPIDGTFVERALDSISGGLSGVAGLDVALIRWLVIDLQARYDLLSGFRTVSARAGASYRFDQSPRGAP